MQGSVEYTATQIVDKPRSNYHADCWCRCDRRERRNKGGMQASVTQASILPVISPGSSSPTFPSKYHSPRPLPSSLPPSLPNYGKELTKVRPLGLDSPSCAFPVSKRHSFLFSLLQHFAGRLLLSNEKRFWFENNRFRSPSPRLRPQPRPASRSTSPPSAFRGVTGRVQICSSPHPLSSIFWPLSALLKKL